MPVGKIIVIFFPFLEGTRIDQKRLISYTFNSLKKDFKEKKNGLKKFDALMTYECM